MYTQNAEQLEKSFKKVIEKYELKISTGLNNGYLPLEDGIPFIEVYQAKKMTVKHGKKIMQEIANEMDICVIFNRVENSYGSGTLIGFMDLDFKKFNETPKSSIPALSEDPEVLEYLTEEDFGKRIEPDSCV